MKIITVNPFRCRVWNLHPRGEENLGEESCKTEIESFEKHGQLVPALGRALRGDRDYDIELIYGARRLFVARHLNVPLLVEVRDIGDRDAIIAMDLENRLRKDVSAYERGTSYARWLREGYFQSQGEIAKSLRISASQVSRLLKLAQLPTPIIEAFGNPLEICEGWGVDLANQMEDPERAKRVLQAARNIAAVAPRPPMREIHKQLCAAGKVERGTSAAMKAVKDQSGAELFRVKRQDDAIVITVSLDILTEESLKRIENSVARVMDPRIPEYVDAELDFELDVEIDEPAAEELSVRA